MSNMAKVSASEHDHARKIKRSLGEHIFDKFNFIFLGLLGLSMLYPFWYELALSLADADKVALSKVYIWPEVMSLESYKNVCSDSNIWNGYLWTIIRTVVGTLVAGSHNSGQFYLAWYDSAGACAGETDPPTVAEAAMRLSHFHSRTV